MAKAEMLPDARHNRYFCPQDNAGNLSVSFVNTL